MTPQEYLSWLDKEIETAEKQASRESHKIEGDQSYYGRATALEDAKEKFLTVITDTQPTESNEFASTIKLPEYEKYRHIDRFMPEVLQTVDEKRKQSRERGFDEYCEAHDLPYNNECPECLDTHKFMQGL